MSEMELGARTTAGRTRRLGIFDDGGEHCFLADIHGEVSASWYIPENFGSISAKWPVSTAIDYSGRASVYIFHVIPSDGSEK